MHVWSTVVLTVMIHGQTLKKRSRHGASLTTADAPTSESEQDDVPPPLRSLLTRPVVLSIACYSLLGFIDVAFMALFPLFCATPIKLGGLGLDPPRIGTALGVFGLFDGLFQGLFFSPTVDRFGLKRVLQFSLWMFVPIFSLFPFMSAVAKAQGAVLLGTWVLVALQFALACLMHMSYGASFSFPNYPSR